MEYGSHVQLELTSYQVTHLVRILKRSIKLRRSFLRKVGTALGPSSDVAASIEENLIQDQSILAYLEYKMGYTGSG